MKAEQQHLTSFIGSNSSYIVPFFQRSYVWKEMQWERLMSDVIYASETKNQLFLGAVIFKKRFNEDGIQDGYTVIDGQQRLTTLFIFFKVLSLYSGQTAWFSGTFQKFDRLPVLTQSHAHKEDFNKIITLTSPIELPCNAPESQINRAYSYFRETLKDIFINRENTNDKGKKIIDYDNVFKLMNFVVITLDQGEDEQQIFDTINSLGVKLTTGELLKNYLFSQTGLNDYENIWKPVFENDSETIKFWDSQIVTGRLNKKTIDSFLYYYLQIKSQEEDIKGDKKQYRRIENLFASYKMLVEVNRFSKDIVALEITGYAKLFMECFRREDESIDLPSNPGIERICFIINNLDTTTLTPYILYILHEVSDDSERNRIFGFLETYIVRRIIVDSNNNNYSDLFTENLIGQKIKTFEALKEYIISKDGSVSLAMPTDEDVKLGVAGTQFKNNKKALALLYLLESSMQTDTHSTVLRTFDAYTLEHLLPKKWKKHWQLLDGVSEESRNRALYTIGNLAMITSGLNNSIRNYDWPTKKHGKNNKPGLSEFAIGLKTVAPYLCLTDWNESEIKKRGQDLAQMIINQWPVKFD